MLQKAIALALCLIVAACNSKEQMLSDQARVYNDFQTTNNASSMFRLAESMKAAGNLDTATNLYEQALQADPTFLPAYIGLSQCLRYEGRAAAALETLKSVPSGDMPKEYFKEMANVMTAQQKPDECVSYYKKAYSIDSSDIGTINGIAVCYDLQGNHAEAQKWYQDAIQMAPALDKLRTNYGLSLALSGQTKEAITTLKAVAYGPDSTSRDRQNLAIAYGLDGQLDQAAKIFSQDLDEEDVRVNLAFVYKLAQSQKYVKAKPVAPEVKHESDNNISSVEPNDIHNSIEAKALPETFIRDKENQLNSVNITPDEYLKKMAELDISKQQTIKIENDMKSLNIQSEEFTKEAQSASLDISSGQHETPLAFSASDGFVSQDFKAINEKELSEQDELNTIQIEPKEE